jgi:subtilisin family serine protease
MAEILSMEPQENNPIKKIHTFLSQASHKRTFATFALLTIVASVPVTAYLSQQSQDVRNRAQEEAPQQGPPKVESVPDEILLKFKPGASEQAKEQIKNELALEVLETIPGIDVHRIRVPEHAKAKVIEALSHNPNIEFVEENHINTIMYPNDLYFPNQWHLSKIGFPAAWETPPAGGSPNIILAIIDTGVQLTHEDLQPNLNGPLIDDDNGHGTAVAGAAAGVINNSVGVAGVCGNCKIFSLKALNATGGGADSTVAIGIMYAAGCDQKLTAINCGPPRAHVINLSLGSYGQSATIELAVNEAWNRGVVVVAAAGNDNTPNPAYPAAYENVISVGGTNSADTKLNVSNYGPTIDVVAPGGGILTTVRDHGDGILYDYSGGTSLAAPLVSGLAGLLLSVNPKLTNQQVRNIIERTAVDLGATGKDEIYGYGRINAKAAVGCAVDLQCLSSIPLTPTPTIRLTPTPTKIPTATPKPLSTPTPTSTNQALTISISSESKTQTSATITFNTTPNIPVTAKIEYAISQNAFTPPTSLSSVSDTVLRTSPHTLTMSNLTKNTTYYYRITVTDTNSKVTQTTVGNNTKIKTSN